MSRAEPVHHVPRECARVSDHSRVGPRRSVTRLRVVATGIAQSRRSRVSARARAGCAASGRNVRGLSHAGELLHLSRRNEAARDCGAGSRRSGPRARRKGDTCATSDSHPGVQGTARERGERPSEYLRDVPRPANVPRVPSTRRCAPVDVPPSSLHHPTPERGICSRGELQRLPQPGAVLSELPSAVGPRRGIANRAARLPRRVSRLQPGAWAGGATESRVVYGVSRGAGLHGLSFRRRRRIRVQPSRAWLQRGLDAVQEPVALRRVSRPRDTRRPLIHR
jgi:hypothetical protein